MRIERIDTKTLLFLFYFEKGGSIENMVKRDKLSEKEQDVRRRYL